MGKQRKKEPKSGARTAQRDTGAKRSKTRKVVMTAVKLAWIVPAVIATIELTPAQTGVSFTKPTIQLLNVVPRDLVALMAGLDADLLDEASA